MLPLVLGTTVGGDQLRSPCRKRSEQFWFRARCLQSARLWFELLVKELMAFGYTQNPVEPCVLNKDIGGMQSTLFLTRG